MSSAPAYLGGDPIAWVLDLANYLRTVPRGVPVARDLEAVHDDLRHLERKAERELEHERERTALCEGLLSEYQERESCK